MTNSVCETLHKDNDSDHLVKEDILVDGQIGPEARGPDPGERRAQHQHQNEGGVEVERHTAASRNHQGPCALPERFSQPSIWGSSS